MDHFPPSGGLAVMQRRRDPVDSLDFFPTPPWATRALVEIVLRDLGHVLGNSVVWEPACGAGHMAEVLREYAREVIASDVHPYVWPSLAPAAAPHHALGSFVGRGPDVIRSQPCDWVITNPPFNLAEDFLERARAEARKVAFLVRTSWLEGGERYERIFRPGACPPSLIAQFSERVPMVKGRWNPKASTATSYAWCLWLGGSMSPGTRFMWIPPGQRKRLTIATDMQRFVEAA